MEYSSGQKNLEALGINITGLKPSRNPDPPIINTSGCKSKSPTKNNGPLSPFTPSEAALLCSSPDRSEFVQNPLQDNGGVKKCQMWLSENAGPNGHVELNSALNTPVPLPSEEVSELDVESPNTPTRFENRGNGAASKATRALNFDASTDRLDLDIINKHTSTPKRRKIVMDDDGSFLPSFYMEEESNSSSDLPAPEISPSCTVTEQVSADSPTISSTASSSKRHYHPRSNTRRRLKEKTKKEERKEAYNAGLPYTTSRNKIKEGRKVGTGCQQSCRKCEKPRLSDENREKLLKEFWSLSSHQQRWDYLSRRVKAHEPKTQNTLPERAKGCVRVYTFKVDDKELRVCKTMFLSTLNINHSWIETALSKVTKKGNITPEKRGAHGNRPNRSTEEQLQSARTHLDLMERVPSHYCRVRSRREYFEAGLNFERLYKMYREWAKNENLTDIATKSQYHEIFMKEYNIGFHIPRKDQCLMCAQWSTASTEEKRAMVKDYDAHLQHKNDIKKIKGEEKEATAENENLCVACFDLEKVLSCPRSEISIMYYKTKMSLYNFTVFDLHSKTGYCFMWTELVAGRGANEIASNLLVFLRKLVLQGKTSFSFYSDSPTGQNRNRMVFALWLYAAVKYNINVVHRFFETGHSFSEVDGMHGRIEKEATKKEIFHPEQWEEVILSAKQDGHSYEINHLTQDLCHDFHKLVDELYWKYSSDGEKVMWSNVKQIRVDHSSPDTIYFKYNLRENEKRIIVNPAKNNFNLSDYQFERAYDKGIPLNGKKAADLKFMLEKKIIPQQYREFYKSLAGLS